MQHKKKVFLLSGSNIEPRISYLERAERELEKQIGEIIKCSSVYESEPWGFTAETTFLNQVLVVMTELTPKDILKRIHEIEEKLGRYRNGSGYLSRTIDIDILYFENEIIETEELTIPHPRMHLRKFTLLPLAEVAGNFRHPFLKKTTNELIIQLDDTSRVWKFGAANSSNDV